MLVTINKSSNLISIDLKKLIELFSASLPVMWWKTKEMKDDFPLLAKTSCTRWGHNKLRKRYTKIILKPLSALLEVDRPTASVNGTIHCCLSVKRRKRVGFSHCSSLLWTQPRPSVWTQTDLHDPCEMGNNGTSLDKPAAAWCVLMVMGKSEAHVCENYNSLLRGVSSTI